MSDFDPSAVTPLVEPGRDAEFLRLLLQHIPVSVSILDKDLRYRMMSNYSFESLKIDPEDLKIGDSLSDCHALMKQNGMLNDELIEQNRLSSEKIAERDSQIKGVKSSLVRLGDGSIHRLVRKDLKDGNTMSIATDVSELVEKDNLLEEALNLGLSGYWVYDFQSKSYSLSKSLQRYFPDDTLAKIDQHGFVNVALYPEDRALARERLSKMVENGDKFEYEVRSRSRAGDERWSRTNGELIRDLKGRPHKIRAFVHDITREREHQLTLKKAKDDAIAASKAKSEFLANMSHEIRTPMNGVLGMAELLAASDIDDRQQEFVNVITSSATALLNIINDILDFSKIEAGALEIDPTPIDLKASIADVAALLVSSAQEKGLELIINYDAKLPRNFIGDAGRIRQVVTNLISNAIKFTHEGHVLVDVAMEQRDSAMPTVSISVQDTGIGIEQEKLDRVFEKFTQADNSTTRLYGGTGLGLTISRRIAELMKGTLTATSSVGEGSTFTMSVPLPRDFEATEVHFDTGLVAKRRVLIVDDIVVNRNVLRSQCENWDMQPVCAQDAMEGVEKLTAAQKRGEPFDLVLLDYLMPGLNGKEFATLIQDRSDLNVPPMIMLSSCDQSVTSSDLARIGIESYLVKPVRERRLFDTIVRTLSNTASAIEASKANKMSDAAQTPALPNPPASERDATATVHDAAGMFHPAQPTTGSRSAAAAPVQPSQNQLLPPQPVMAETRSPTSPGREPASEGTAQGQTAVVTGATEKQEILVAEDFPLNRDVVRLMLAETPFEPVFAENGQIAVELYTNEPDRFPAIVMDISMPVMDGYEASRRIRAWETERGEQHPVPIIALTGHALKNDRNICLEAGMDDYLTKPVKQSELLERLETLSGRVVQKEDSIRLAS